MKMDERNQRRAGFSLVEVSMAMMIISIGMITLFGLFPASMKQGAEAYQDTHTAQFAEYVLNGIRANFDTAEDYEDWKHASADIGLDGLGVAETDVPVQFAYPIGSTNYVRYILELVPPPELSLKPNDADDAQDVVEQWGNRSLTMNWQVRLWAWSGRYGPTDAAIHKRRSQWFATEIFYGGMQ